MNTWHVGHKLVGTLADSERLIGEWIRRKEVAVLRDAGGRPVGFFEPIDDLSSPPDTPLSQSREEAYRRLAEGPGKTLEEWRREQGDDDPLPV